MTIVVPTSGAFDIETYGGLRTYIAEVLDRTDLTDQIPNFIHLAEYRLGRILPAPHRQGTYNMPLTAGMSTANLPADYSQLVAVNIGGVPLEQVSTAGLYEGWNGATSGQPRVFSVGNTTLKFAPTPDAEYIVALDYLKSIIPLSDVNPSNWILSCHADLLVYGALLQAEAYLSNDDRLAVWKLAFDEAIAEANAEGLRHRTSASPLRLRSPVCV